MVVVVAVEVTTTGSGISWDSVLTEDKVLQIWHVSFFNIYLWYQSIFKINIKLKKMSQGALPFLKFYMWYLGCFFKSPTSEVCMRLADRGRSKDNWLRDWHEHGLQALGFMLWAFYTGPMGPAGSFPWWIAKCCIFFAYGNYSVYFCTVQYVESIFALNPQHKLKVTQTHANTQYCST